MTVGKQSKKQHTSKVISKKKHHIGGWALGIAGTLASIALLVFIAFQVSPWPSAMLIRWAFDKGGHKTSQALEKHVPSGITQVENLQYSDGDKDAYLDVFYPESTTTPLPTVVWVHGGAWVSGNKDNVDNYLRILASKGYTAVGVNYSIAPEKKYPTPILQINQALGYLQAQADQLHIDKNTLALAGDSAGSQLAAQVATIITNPSYAKEVAITPSIAPSQLKVMVLNCGAYDLALPNYNGPDGKFLKSVLWAYSGTKDFLHDKNIQHASVVDYVTKSFPPSFITAGNVDPLESQSREFAQKLSLLGVPTSALFYDKDHQPELQHEYQFNLDQHDGQQALVRITDFLKSYLK